MNALFPAPGTPLTLDDLASLPRWVAWQTAHRRNADPSKEKPTKVPYNPRTGGGAMADKPSTWGTRASAEALAAGLPKPFGAGGVGLELGDMGNGSHLAGIDLDTCLDATGMRAFWATDVLTRFDTYAEVSPSAPAANCSSPSRTTHWP